MPFLFIPLWAIIGGSAVAGAGAAVVAGNAWGALDDTIEGTGNAVQSTANLTQWAVIGGGLFLLAKWKKLI